MPKGIIVFSTDFTDSKAIVLHPPMSIEVLRMSSLSVKMYLVRKREASINSIIRATNADTAEATIPTTIPMGVRKPARKKNTAVDATNTNKIAYIDAVTFETSGSLMMLILTDMKRSSGENKVSPEGTSSSHQRKDRLLRIRIYNHY